VAVTNGHQESGDLRNGASSGAEADGDASSHAPERILESRLPVELIIAEAKSWGVADEVALQMLPTGRVNVFCNGPGGAGFAEHLLALQGAGRFNGR